MKTVTFDDRKWRLVPVEATQDMVDAGAEHMGVRCCYKAMLAAAPTPPETADSDRRDAERYRWLRDSCGVVEYKAIAGSIGPGMLPSGQTLEQAIDAAMDGGSES